VQDLIDGLMRLMDSAPDVTGPINIGNPREFTVRELAEKVIELTGSRSTIVEQPLPQDDPRQRQPDISKARQVLGWNPKIGLEDGLVTTIDYFAQLIGVPATGASTSQPRSEHNAAV
jgi:UDP-glucuronate decarboxylase